MVPIAHGGSGVAYKADVTGAQASPLTSEIFAAMAPGDRDQFVFMQNGEPGACTARRDRRRGAARLRADQRVALRL